MPSAIVTTMFDSLQASSTTTKNTVGGKKNSMYLERDFLSLKLDKTWEKEKMLIIPVMF